MMSKLILPIFIGLVALYAPSFAKADSPPVTFQAALELWRMASPPADSRLFEKITFLPVRGDNAPLARYSPKGTRDHGMIEIGQNMRRYRNEYIYLSSDLDMSTKPDFDQYMTVLMTLSLANESAHYRQDESDSLKDFYKFYDDGQTNNACALYSLQQHVSDIVMLKMAMNLEQMFLGMGSVKGLNALRIALEKNELRYEFEDFRNAMNERNAATLDAILRNIRMKRNAANMAGVHFCPPYGDAILDDVIVKRATMAAGYPFIPEQNYQNSSLTKDYND